MIDNVVGLKLTFNVVCAVIELQCKYVIDWTIGIQCIRVLVVANIAVFSPQDQNGPIDQLQNQLLVLTWRKTTGWHYIPVHFSHNIRFDLVCISMNSPTESLTAESWPFFLVHMYFPLLARSATRRPSHTMSNMVLAPLHTVGDCIYKC